MHDHDTMPLPGETAGADPAAALALLAGAAVRSQAENLHHDQATGAALDLLAEQDGGAPPVAAFRAALAIPHPVTRRQAVAAAYKRLCRAAQGQGSEAE